MTVLIPGMTGDRERVEIRPESEHVSSISKKSSISICSEWEHESFSYFLVLNHGVSRDFKDK